MPTSPSCDTIESHQHSEWGWFDGGTAGSRAGSLDEVDLKSLTGQYDNIMQQEVEDSASGTQYFSGDRTRRRLTGGSGQRRSSHSAFSYKINCGMCQVNGAQSIRNEREQAPVALPSCTVWRALRSLFWDGAKLHDESHCAPTSATTAVTSGCADSPDRKNTPDKKKNSARCRGTSGISSQKGVSRGLTFYEWVDVCYIDCWASDREVADGLWQV